MSPAIHMIAVGKNKDQALQSLIDDYCRRLTWPVTIVEIPVPNCADSERKSREAVLIRAAIPAKAVLVALDERGDNLDSPAFARKLQHLVETRSLTITIIIGGADGLDERLRREADLTLSFGKLTWPHMMVRLMLVEQLYRASTIIAGHPYHRV